MINNKDPYFAQDLLSYKLFCLTTWGGGIVLFCLEFMWEKILQIPLHPNLPRKNL